MVDFNYYFKSPSPGTSSSARYTWYVSGFVLLWLAVCTVRFILNDPYLSQVVFVSFISVLGDLVSFFRFPENFFPDLLRGVVSLALQTGVGILFLRLWLRLPWWFEIGVGSFLGIGLATFVLELFAIFFLLNKFTILLTLFGLMALFYLLGRKMGQGTCTVSFSAPLPQGLFSRMVFFISWILLGFITILTFYHTLFFPVSYWDAMILYVNYGRMTYEQGGFPVLICLQVGLGLGANYPHLYPLFQAVTAILVSHWSDLYGQLLPPLASLGTILVIYAWVLQRYRSHLIAVLSALAFRQITYVTVYFTWASDYALVMFYTSLYLFFLDWYLRRNTFRSLQPLLCVSAIFPHINYLGWAVFPSTVLAIGWNLWLKNFEKKELQKAGGAFLLWFILALTWYIRNWIVTGNPVYAFFPEIFGGRNINLNVLASASQEWTAHGFGAAQLGDTLIERVLNSIPLFITDYRFAPVLIGFFIPAFLLGWKREQVFYWISAVLLLIYFLYEYVISGLYWYHAIAVFPIFAFYAARFLSQIPYQWLVNLFGVVLILSSVVPGLSFAIMGGKLPDPQLRTFAYAGISREHFYLRVYPDVAPVWQYINRNLEQGALILTHDNRHLAYRRDLQIIHLDDCGLTSLYGRTYPEIHQALLQQGVDYYLQIPDENTHPITAQLGHKFYLNNREYFEPVTENGEVKLYRLAR